MALDEFLRWEDGTDTRYDSGRFLVEIYRREEVDWRREIVADPDSVISLPSVDIEISISELYEGLAFPHDPDL